MRPILAFLTVMAATITSAQTIEFFFFSKHRDYDQTTAGAPVLVANPYLIGASVDGTSLSGSYPVSPTVAVASTGSQTLITLASDFDGWHFESIGYADQTALNAAYGSGTYTFQSSSFASVILNLSNTDLYPNAPMATISTNSGLGFQWSGGVLLVNPSLFTTLTVATNTFGTNFNALSNHIGISGNSFTSNVNAESFNSAANTLSLNIASATFLGGSTNKNIELEFNNIIDFLLNTPSAGITAVSAFTSATTINIQVIPEPSTYAEIFGVMALAGAMFHRRRRLA